MALVPESRIDGTSYTVSVTRYRAHRVGLHGVVYTVSGYMMSIRGVTSTILVLQRRLLGGVSYMAPVTPCLLKRHRLPGVGFAVTWCRF